MVGLDLSGAQLQGANLQNADLRGAILRGADLRGAKLTGANLTKADLRQAVLSPLPLGPGRRPRRTCRRPACAMPWSRSADLSEAVFDDADLRGADFTGARVARPASARWT
jgi:uncharacterized protein YjbI with pentapeptide repeats